MGEYKGKREQTGNRENMQGFILYFIAQSSVNSFTLSSHLSFKPYVKPTWFSFIISTIHSLIKNIGNIEIRERTPIIPLSLFFFPVIIPQALSTAASGTFWQPWLYIVEQGFAERYKRQGDNKASS